MAKKSTAQSIDFGEINSMQSDAGRSVMPQEKWDKIWHNYKDPENCAGRKRVTGCTICNQLMSNQDK